MSALDVLSKEIDEAYKNVASQHEQVKYYFQIYIAALVGLFTLSGYFSSAGINRDASIIGIISTLTVFFLGWIFLSITAHKVSMIIFFYKHLALLRKHRLEESGLYAGLHEQYVLPTDKNKIRMPSLLKYLPYLVFVFNFLILCGGVAYYLSPHLAYHQVLACTIVVAIILGTPYPAVCLSFNRHIRCAIYAQNVAEVPRIEDFWYRALHAEQPISKKTKYWVLGLLMAGSVAVAYFSLNAFRTNHREVIIYLSWAGIVSFAVFRFYVERPELLANLMSAYSYGQTHK